jgi:hypothetical protein
MTKLQAEAIAKQHLLAINVHYQAEYEALQKHQAEAQAAVAKWLDDKAYRKKENSEPHVPTYCMQRHHGCDMMRLLKQQPQAEEDRHCVRCDRTLNAGQRDLCQRCKEGS